MNKGKYSQIVRLITAGISLAILVVIFQLVTGDFAKFIASNQSDEKICFLSGALLLILGSYLIEPYFTKPSDSIVNAVSVLIALLGVTKKTEFYGYNFILAYSICVLVISIITIISKDRWLKLSKGLYYLIDFTGKAKVIFSILFMLSIYSYYALKNDIGTFILLAIYWCVLILTPIIEKLVSRVIKIKELLSSKSDDVLGVAIGCDNPYLFTANIDSSYNLNRGQLLLLNRNNGICSVGIIIDVKHLINSTRVKFLIMSSDGMTIDISKDNMTKKSNRTKCIFDTENSISLLNLCQCDGAKAKIIKEHHLLRNMDKYIGYITIESNINTIRFYITQENTNLGEGDIIKSKIDGQDTLFQVINGNTKEEVLEGQNKHGFTIGIGRKLGNYNTFKKELEVVKWIPGMYEPVYKINISEDVNLDQLAQNSIGRLPNTNFSIPINDFNSLVTHNTAILGILGIGKSCLSFELIKKVVENNIKVVCIDITNQYKNPEAGLPKYIKSDFIQEELSEQELKELRDSKNNDGSRNDATSWGNQNNYTNILNSSFSTFLSNDDKNVLILNPDWHPVTKAGANFNIENLVDCTAAEKTRIITESLFKKVMSMGETNTARVLLVFEEAHSLVPEWNSTAHPGDSSATNGTAKVILQGRKFGLGCMVITQRTANVSKSLLNQCNTMFALRVFDDTGKNFLQNYIGSDYADTLPTLEERHAIVIGKALKLKQPVIISLNDRKYFV